MRLIKRYLAIGAVALGAAVMPAYAHAEAPTEEAAAAENASVMKPGQVDIFMGLDFNYRDIYHNGRVFDVLVQLTPGVKWNMGRRWQIAAQGVIPVINQFGPTHRDPEIGVLAISKQMPLFNRLRLKASAGVFTYNRYGVDLKAMLVVNKWFALSGEAGVTGYFSLYNGWNASTPERFTFRIGPEFWLAKWNTQFTIRGGRYTFGDYGIKADAIRHFRHCSVGVFASYGNVAKENAGFDITVMLPPYKRTRRKVNFRPASSFHLGYRNDANYYSLREYATDPEQNVRQGWFDADMLPWGPETMTPDFVVKEKGKEGAK